jgi:hypothetical protein
MEANGPDLFKALRDRARALAPLAAGQRLN